jgi:hypothetical protein
MIGVTYKVGIIKGGGKTMQNMQSAVIAESVSIPDLYAAPDKIAEQLKRVGQLVLTNRDGPMALMLNIDSPSLEATLADLRRLRVQRIMQSAQASAAENGTSNMTLEEINAEISSMREERKSRKNAG